MKPKVIAAHMQAAEVYAKLSTARRLQVGAIIVKDDRIISIGYNGMPAGWDNNCEEESVELYSRPSGAIHRTVLKTKPEVLHAEANAIAKVARSSESAENSVLFVTHAPCIECAKLIYQSGVSKVYFKHQYRDQSGLTFLNKASIITEQLD
jgi:dCMP deaminase